MVWPVSQPLMHHDHHWLLSFLKGNINDGRHERIYWNPNDENSCYAVLKYLLNSSPLMDKRFTRRLPNVQKFGFEIKISQGGPPLQTTLSPIWCWSVPVTAILALLKVITPLSPPTTKSPLTNLSVMMMAVVFEEYLYKTLYQFNLLLHFTI